MQTVNHKTQGWNNIATTLFLVMVIAYFSYHAISGDRGFLALLQLSQKVEHMQTDLDELKAERLSLEYRVKRLRTESLDLDLLDEQARSLLGYSAPDELVYSLEN